MIWNLIYYTDIILFIIVLFTVIYLLFFAIASQFVQHIRMPKTRKVSRFLILIPAYAEDEVIEETVTSILNQEYESKNYDIIVISDHMKEITNMRLSQYPITLLRPCFEESTKAQSLNFAIKNISTFKLYDMVVILDADNLVDPTFLQDINVAYQAGSKVIQAHRVSKNRDTHSAILDATFEEINNSIFRIGHVSLGLSSALIGSGIAIDFKWFKENVGQLKTAGEDKELEALLMKQRIYVDYLDQTLVYDEKTRAKKDFNKQRRRWMNTQWQSLHANFKYLLPALITKRYDYADKIIQWMLMPRIAMMGVIGAMSLIWPFFHWSLAIKWWSVFVLVLFIFALATPNYLVDKKWEKAFLHAPILILGSLFNFIHLSRSQKFSHTQHSRDNHLKKKNKT